LNRNAAEECRVVVPPQVAIAEFASLAWPLLGYKDRLVEEAETLATIREALLPKLIVGEIRVSDTEDPEEEIGQAAEQHEGVGE